MTDDLSERDISDYKESERNAEYIKRKFLSNDSKCEHEWRVVSIKGHVPFFTIIKCTKCFGHKTVESKPISDEN